MTHLTLKLLSIIKGTKWVSHLWHWRTSSRTNLSVAYYIIIIIIGFPKNFHKLLQCIYKKEGE